MHCFEREVRQNNNSFLILKTKEKYGMILKKKYLFVFLPNTRLPKLLVLILLVQY